MIEVNQAAPSEWTAVSQNIYSQYGEDGIIAEIFRRIGTTNKQCFEVGAADGKWFSNSRRLIDEGWRAALIEADEKNWPELDKLDGERVTVVHGRAEASGANSLDSILTQCKFDARPDLGIIDVDGQEFYLWNGMLKFRPRVLVVEYDPHVDPAFVPDLNGAGQAGLHAILSIAASKGYMNVTSTATNLIFIDGSERAKFLAFASPAEQIIKSVVQHKQESDVDKLAPVLAGSASTHEIKICTILSRPRFGLNSFFDCASEGLAPWHIPLSSFYGVFWGQHMQTAMENALDEGMDWILTLDYDSMFTSRHLQLLIDELGKHPEIDAIAPLQVRRGQPKPIFMPAAGQGPTKMTGKPVQVRTAHFGLTILRVEKLRKMPKPWFWSKPAPDGSWGEGRLDDDIYFWANWGDSGNNLFVHTGCRIGHVEEMVGYYDDKGQVRHDYISKWRSDNGHIIKSAE